MLNTNIDSNLELGINIDHIATLRNVRGTNYPSPVHAAILAEQAGADLITLHLREDRRHIRDDDILTIKSAINTRMNLECAITAEMLSIACKTLPHDVCLVPEKRQELTTEGGLDVIKYQAQLKDAVEQLKEHGIRVSIFIDADAAQIEKAHHVGADCIEIHTGKYANFSNNSKEQRQIYKNIVQSCKLAKEYNLRVNAGHGLHYSNVQAIAYIDEISELNIGHAIVAHAVFVGWQNAIREMKSIISTARIKTMINSYQI